MSTYELAKSLFNQKEVKRNTSSNTIRYGTVTQENQNGKIKAILDGSSVEVVLSCETPVTIGQRVTVTNSNGVYRVIALTGVVTQLNETTVKAETGYTYISSLLAQDIQADNLIANYGYVDTLKASDVYADDLVAANAYINELKAEDIDAESLSADHASIGTLTSKVGFIDDLTAENITAADIIADHASVEELETEYARIDDLVVEQAEISEALIGRLDAVDANILQLDADKADISDLNAATARIGSLEADSAEIKNDLQASMADIDELEADNVTIHSSLTAAEADISDLTATTATISGNLSAATARIGTVEATYLKADLANATEATFENLYSESGLLTNAQMVEGVITGTLDATNVSIAHLDVGDLTVNTINGQAVPTAKSAQDIIDDLYDYNPVTGVITYSAGAQIASLIDNIEDIQSQIDGSISTWFYDVPPSLTNPPASTWTTDDEKDIHLGDLYYDTDSGYCYRWMVSNDVYSWQKISDSDVTAAMSLASEAKDLADNKRRVFYSTPTPPYDEGDLWSGGSTGDLKICTTAKDESESFANSDWSIATKYTDDTATNELETNLGTSGGVSINADNISAGTIDASQVTVANLNASNITSGTLAAARISAQSISTSKLLMSNPENYCLMSEHDPETLGREGAVLTDDGWIVQSDSESQNNSIIVDLSSLCLYTPGQEDEFQLTATVKTEANASFLFLYETLPALDSSSTQYAWASSQVSIPANTETRISCNLILSDYPAYDSTIEKYGRFSFYFLKTTSSGYVNAKIKSIHIYKKASADLIVDGAITASKISASAVTSDKIAAGAITSAKIDAGAVNASHIAAGSITADLLDADDIYGQNITITGDFDLGGNGALSYSSATDSLSIRASDITLSGTSVYNSINGITSRGSQLVDNYNGLMGNNYNFSSWTFTSAEVNGTPGSFTQPQSTTRSVLYTNNLIPIDHSQVYYFSVDAKSKNGLASLYTFINFYDVDNLEITQECVYFVPGTLTYLTRELKSGDTKVYLADLSNWDTESDSATSSSGGNRRLMFWGYKNSLGYEYPEETYTRHYTRSNSYSTTGIDVSNGIITLNAPYSGATMPAGRKVSQGSGDNGTYSYAAWTGQVVPSEWTTRGNIVFGYIDIPYKSSTVKRIYPGTAKVNIGFLWNYNQANDQLYITNVSLATIDKSSAKNVYGTCETGSGAGIKAVTTTEPFILETGSHVFVKFTYANTTATPYLNVNSTGLAAIRTANGTSFDSSAYSWAANQTVGFTYSGDFWLLDEGTTLEKTKALTSRVSSAEIDIDTNAAAIALKANSSDVYTKTQIDAKGYLTVESDAITSVVERLTGVERESLYGTSTTAAATTAKVVTVSGISTLTPTVGMHLYVLFSKANTANAPTIKIGTGPAYPIRTNMSGAFDKSFGSWSNSSLVSFTFTNNSTESFWLIDSGEALEKATAAIKDLSNFRTEIQQTARDITIQMNEYALKDSVNASIDSLNDKANALGLDVENLTSAISVTSTGGVPKITLLADPAAESGTIYTEITNSEIAFVESGTKVSYINNKKLNISNASVEGELNFGNYVLKRRSNDHLTLVYAG